MSAASSDFSDVDAFFRNEASPTNPIFCEKEILFAPDANNGAYNNFININMLTMSPHLVVPSDMPVVLTGSMRSSTAIRNTSTAAAIPAG